MSRENGNTYYRWLALLLNINQEERSYFLLLKMLHKKEFYWSIKGDENRALDSQGLRDEFFNCVNSKDVEYKLYGPCSMLEMLIALARRMNDIMYKSYQEDQTSRWFWVMMENCGLEKFTDEAFIGLGGEIEIQIILNHILERTYKKDGNGGLFPVKITNKDQRKIEIWYQMMTYLVEKYYIE